MRVLAKASIFGAIVLCGCSTSNGASASQPSVGSSGSRAIPQSVADLPFVDDHGATTTLASFKGKTVVLADFLTLCQEVCPLTTANLLKVQQAVARAGLSSDIELVEVTVDPERDTPARLAAYRNLIGAGANWEFLTGSAANVAALWKWFGIAYETTAEDSPAGTDWWTGKPLTFDVGHSDALFFIDAHDTQRYVVVGSPNVASLSQIPAALQSFLNDAGRDNVASPEAGTWTAADVDSVLAWITGRRIAQ
ncbi:MAG: SCO family protein [Acidothermaceae bacterium]